MANRYVKAIECLADALRAREEFNENVERTRGLLTVAEIVDNHGNCLDEDLLAAAFDGSRVKGTRLLIDEASYVKTVLRGDGVDIALHVDEASAPKVVLHRLCSELGVGLLLKHSR